MKKEIKKILNRKEFYFVLMIMFFAVYADFLYACYLFREVDMSGVISAYDGTILSNVAGTPFTALFGLFLPVCVSMIASTIALEERKMGLNGCIYTRISKKRYILQQAACVMVVSFLVVELSLLVNLIFALITFPVQGFNTMSEVDYDKLLHIDTDFIFDSLYRLHPYKNIILFIFLRGAFAGVFAWLAYGISFFGMKNKTAVILSSFIVIVFEQQLFMGIVKRLVSNETVRIWCNTNILDTNHYGKAGALLVTWIMLFILGLCGMVKGMQLEELS